MRVLLLHFLNHDNKKHVEIIKNLEQSAVSKGHQLTVLNAKDPSDSLHFALYEYVAVVTTPQSFIGAKISSFMREVLSFHGDLTGKKGCALVVKNGFSSQKMCRLTMDAMEKQGMLLDYFQVIESPVHARAVGKKIG